jgi:glycosyltransferase involved in cell wall biosynthesis
VVVDNNSNDNTVEIAKRYTDKVYTKGPERSAQRNHAASMSCGEILIVLDSDMVLTSRVVDEIVIAFTTNAYQRALVIPEESFGVGFWSACKKLERSFYIGVSWMEAARAFRRSTFEELGGYDEANTGTEDYDLPHRLDEKYGSESVGRINSLIMHNEGELDLFKSCKKKFYYARALDVYVNKNANKHHFSKQSSPIMRFALYFKSPFRLLKNPFIGLGMIFMKICEMSSGMLGYLMRKQNFNMQKNIYK